MFTYSDSSPGLGGITVGAYFFFSSEGTDSYVEIKINTGLAVGAKDSW